MNDIQQISSCELCPRQCKAKRTELDGNGFCKAPGCLKVFRWGPHFGEEPPITGKSGSGCIFFSHCTMKCIYCQNSPWSWQGKGEIKTVNDLAEIMRTLAIEDKVENWNLVSPTPYLPHIRQAASILRKDGIKLPFVWNSSGYERVETLEEYSDLCDFALFDLRYATNSTSFAASTAPNYPSYARNAIKWAYNRAPEKTIVRILVLPGLADEAIDSLKFLATEVSQEIAVSIMSQYTPAFLAKDKPPFNRKVLESEYDKVVSAAADLGFENGWTQGFESSSEVLDYLGENMTPGHGEIS